MGICIKVNDPMEWETLAKYSLHLDDYKPILSNDHSFLDKIAQEYAAAKRTAEIINEKYSCYK